MAGLLRLLLDSSFREEYEEGGWALLGSLAVAMRDLGPDSQVQATRPSHHDECTLSAGGLTLVVNNISICMGLKAKHGNGLRSECLCAVCLH